MGLLYLYQRKNAYRYCGRRCSCVTNLSSMFHSSAALYTYIIQATVPVTSEDYHYQSPREKKWFQSGGNKRRKMLPRYLSRYSDPLWAGWSGDRIPMEARFPAHLQAGSGAHPASNTMGTWSLPGKNRPGLGVVVQESTLITLLSQINPIDIPVA